MTATATATATASPRTPAPALPLPTPADPLVSAALHPQRHLPHARPQKERERAGTRHLPTTTTATTTEHDDEEEEDEEDGKREEEGQEHIERHTSLAAGRQRPTSMNDNKLDLDALTYYPPSNAQRDPAVVYVDRPVAPETDADGVSKEGVRPKRRRTPTSSRKKRKTMHNAHGFSSSPGSTARVVVTPSFDATLVNNRDHSKLNAVVGPTD